MEVGVELKDASAGEFRDGFNCAQAVFAAAAPSLGLDRETALRVAGGFGGGMGRLGEVCGAATGAFMAIGLAHGKHRAGDDEARERTYTLVREFARRFRERHGSLLCRELLGCDLSTAEGRRTAKERSVHTSVCPALVASAAQILEELL
jgi:C_GCAxxG_C_C family probable redox protein